MCKNVVYKANGAQAILYNCDEKKMWHKPIEGDFAISAKKNPMYYHVTCKCYL